MIYIYLLLSISLAVNLLFIIYDVFPYLIPIIRRKLKLYRQNINKTNDIDSVEKKVLKTSLSSIRRKKSLMIWSNIGLFSKLLSCFNQVRNSKNYHYPRAFLLFGISEYLMKTGNRLDLFYLKNIFDKYYISRSGIPCFTLNKVDQAPFGVTALTLYEAFREEKYKIFSDYIYTFIRLNYSRNGFVHYREKSEIEYGDTIGMILSFLIRYHKLTNNKEALSIASNQMRFYIEYGVDNNTFLPAHGINLDSKIKVGSSNWGRGIGWYFLGLKELYEFNGSNKKEYEGICNTIKKIKNEEGLWGQFPGSSDTFDASTTTLFIYSLPEKEYNLEAVIEKLNKYISKDGFILNTSGDTESANRYSRVFGKSELSQGILMLIMSRYKS
jgi:rhamnogalacturonyl hydrolase YesR